MPKSRKGEAEREERRDKVMTLLLAGGTTRSIGQTLGMNHATVARDIEARLQGAAAACYSTADYRELHRQRIEMLLLQWWPRSGRDPASLDRVVRLLEREAKLLGLDSPQKLEHSGKDGGPIQTDMKVILDALNDPEAREALDALSRRLESQPSSDSG